MKMETYYIVRVKSIMTFYLTMSIGGEDALDPKLTPYVGNAYLFTERSSAERYADIIKGYGHKVDICKLGFIGSYEVFADSRLEEV